LCIGLQLLIENLGFYGVDSVIGGGPEGYQSNLPAVRKHSVCHTEV